jgi:hypothetical protein
MRVIRKIIVMLVVAALGGAVCGQDVDPLAAARATVDTGWADRLADLDTMSAADKLVLAEDLIEAARGTSRDAGERFVMADLAATIAIPVGTSDAESLARKAMVLAHGVLPYDPQTHAKREYDLLKSRLDTMIDDHAERDDIETMGIATSEAALTYAQLLMVDGELNECLTVVRSGLRLAERYEVADVTVVCTELEKTLKVLRLRQARLETARRELDVAEMNGSPEAVSLARREIGDLLLGIEGDLLTAQPYLTGTDHPLAAAADVARAVAGNERASLVELLGAITAIRVAVREAESPVRETMLTTGLLLCDAYDGLAQSADDRTYGVLYRRAMKRAGGQSETDERIALLRKNYPHFNGDLVLLDGDRARVTYDFSEERQLKDWTDPTLEWSVDRDTLRQTSGGSQRRQGLLTNGLRFRADRPMTISFDACAMDQIAFAATYAPWGGDVGGDTCGFWLRDRENRRRGDGKEGLDMVGYRGSHRWHDASRLRPDADYTMKVIFDGAGGVTWWINDSLVHDYTPLPTDAVFTTGSMGVRLIARTASERQPTSYDNIVIEGELLSAPKDRPAN